MRSVRAEAQLERSWRPRSLKLRPPSPGFSAARSPRPSRALVLDSELARTRPHPLRTMSMLGLDVRKLRSLPAKELIPLPLLAQQSGGGPLLCARAGSKRGGGGLCSLPLWSLKSRSRKGAQISSVQILSLLKAAVNEMTLKTQVRIPTLLTPLQACATKSSDLSESQYFHF